MPSSFNMNINPAEIRNASTGTMNAGYNDEDLAANAKALGEQISAAGTVDAQVQPAADKTIAELQKSLQGGGEILAMIKANLVKLGTAMSKYANGNEDLTQKSHDLLSMIDPGGTSQPAPTGDPSTPPVNPGAPTLPTQPDSPAAPQAGPNAPITA